MYPLMMSSSAKKIKLVDLSPSSVDEGPMASPPAR
jgi:hypothetical protein